MNIKSYFESDGKDFQQVIEMMILLYYEEYSNI